MRWSCTNGWKHNYSLESTRLLNWFASSPSQLILDVSRAQSSEALKAGLAYC